MLGGTCSKTGLQIFEVVEYVRRHGRKFRHFWSKFVSDNSFAYFLQYTSYVVVFQSCKTVYDRIIDLKIATPQIIMNYGMFLEENNHFEEAFKAYEKGLSLFKWPHVYDIWNTYLMKFIQRYVRNVKSF